MSTPIIDTHVHFYMRQQSALGGWPYPSDPEIYGDFLLADYLKDFAGSNVRGVVAIATRSDPEYVEWIDSMARSSALVLSYVSAFPSHQELFLESTLETLNRQECSGLRVHERNLEKLVSSDVFSDVLVYLRANNQLLEVFGSPNILPLTTKIAGLHPKLRIVIDHVAGCRPDVNLDCSTWALQLKRAGAHENIFCKFSALVELQGQTRESKAGEPERTQRLIEEVLAAFPISRLIFGSNWPVSQKYGSLKGNQKLIEAGLGSLSHTEISAVFFENAQDIFGSFG